MFDMVYIEPEDEVAFRAFEGFNGLHVEGKNDKADC